MTYTEAMKQGHLVLPAALLFNYHKIFQSADDFLVWQFLYFQNTNVKEDIASSEIAESIGKTITDVNRSISRLTENQLLAFEVNHDRGMVFDTSLAFQKLDAVLDETVKEQLTSDNVLQDLVKVFESELGRYLSPLELEDLEKTIKDDETDPDLVRAALREAVFSNKTNWKYINAILRNWRRDGITTVRQVEERRRQREEADPTKVTVSNDFLNAMSLWSNED